ncbi:MAG: GAF domain-containing sensor histidine kinase [Candidatus Promineifilaceae bacterium]
MVQPPTETDADKLRRRNRELSILNTIAEALNRSVDLDEALQATLAQVAELLDLQTGWIWLLREGTGDSYLAAAKDLPPALANNPIRMEGSCYCLDTYRADDLEGAANVNVVTCSRLKSLVDGTDGLRYHASIPLYAGEEKLGVLNVASPDWRELSDGDLRLLHTVGDMLSIAVERARLFGKSARLGALEERNRLAREIHDTLAQGLTAVALQLESADVILESGRGSDRARRTVQQALALTRANLEEARRSVLDLRAAPLEGRTLEEALAILARKQASLGGFKVHFEAVGGRPLEVRAEVGLYRIAQEALSNIVQHAQAAHVYLQLSGSTEAVTMIVEDDGQGFDPAEMVKNRYGLIGMNERVSLLGGQLHIESGPGAGTRLVVTIPH